MTSDQSALIYSGIEVSHIEKKVTITGLDLGEEYHFAVRGVAHSDSRNRNTVATELSYVFDYAVPTVLPVYIPLTISNALQFTGVSVTNLSQDPAHLQFTAMGLGHRHRLSIGGNAVPQVFDQFDVARMVAAP